MNLLIAPKVHTKFGVDLLSGSGEEVENAKSLTDRRTDGRTTDNTPRHKLSDKSKSQVNWGFKMAGYGIVLIFLDLFFRCLC